MAQIKIENEEDLMQALKDSDRYKEFIKKRLEWKKESDKQAWSLI